MLVWRLEVVIFITIVTILAGCAPLIPSNYMGPSTIQTSQEINNQWVSPQLIRLNAETLNTPIGRKLLEPVMRPRPYRVGAYDNLNIIIWGHPELSTVPTNAYIYTANTNMSTNNPSIIIDANGTIFFPYVGHLHVEGLTVNQIQAKITQRLAMYIRHPQVTVQVANYRNSNIYVLGEVNHPGAQPLTDKPLTMMAAVSNAGDINPSNADPTHIYLIRGSYKHPTIYWLDATTPQSLLIATHVPLVENDIVYVSSAGLSGWNRFLNQILPSLQAYIITKEFA